MKTLLRINGRETTVEWEKLDACSSATYRFRQESQEERTASVERLPESVYSVLAGGRSIDVLVEQGPSGMAVFAGGRRFEIEIIDPRSWAGSVSAAGSKARQNLSATMPGKIIRVLVAEGDEVEAGQGIAVVEAMKMQNEMKAPRAGRVASLKAVAGATVEAGEVLAVIE